MGNAAWNCALLPPVEARFRRASKERLFFEEAGVREAVVKDGGWKQRRIARPRGVEGAVEFSREAMAVRTVGVERGRSK